MKENFEKALKAVLAHEGGYVNHPKDPGGATNMGITQAVYDDWTEGFDRSVKYITKDEVRAIYKRRYWDAVRGDELPSGVDYAVFDYAVNSGVSRAVRYLQMVTGAKVDAIMGPQTLLHAMDKSPIKIINELCDRRLVFLRNLSTFQTFGRGWVKRVDGVRKMALEMAGSPLPSKPAIEQQRKRTLVDLIIALFNALFRRK